MRGLHFQKPPFAQSKLVRCVKGSVLDVAVDIRKGSPTYGEYVAVELSEDKHLQFIIPRGFAHCFAVLSKVVIFQYKCDNYYAPQADSGVSILDESIGIDWNFSYFFHRLIFIGTLYKNLPCKTHNTLKE